MRISIQKNSADDNMKFTPYFPLGQTFLASILVGRRPPIQPSPMSYPG